jgi:hypothetical protein
MNIRKTIQLSKFGKVYIDSLPPEIQEEAEKWSKVPIHQVPTGIISDRIMFVMKDSIVENTPPLIVEKQQDSTFKIVDNVEVKEGNIEDKILGDLEPKTDENILIQPENPVVKPSSKKKESTEVNSPSE